jgi:hypothetical protein
MTTINNSNAGNASTGKSQINQSQANQQHQQSNINQSQTNTQADSNQAPADQDRTANAVFNNDQVSSRQVEGLTDADELSEQMEENSEDFSKNPESALNEQGASNQAKTEQNDGSAGNQKIRDAVEHLNKDKLEDNVLEQDKRGTVDIPTPSSPD